MTDGYRRLLGYALPYWRGWAKILAVSLLCAAFGLLQAWPLKILFDHVLGRSPMSPTLSRILGPLPGSGSPTGLLAWVVAAGLAIFVFNSIADVYLTCAWIRVGQRMVYDLAGDLFAHTQRQSLLFHGKNPVGDSISRITGDCWCVHTIVDNLLFKPKLALITVAAMLGLMVRIDLGLTLISLAAAPFMGGFAWWLGPPVRAAERTRRELEGEIQSHVQRTLSGIAVVQAFCREDEERRRFRDLIAAAVRTQRWGTLLASLHGLLVGLATTLATVAILWVGSHRVLAGRLTIGEVLVFLAYLGLLQGQLRAFTGLYTTLQAAAAGMERVLEMMGTSSGVPDLPGAPDLPPARGHLVLDRVTFGYEPGRPVLRGASLEVRPGETVALVGPTGAGKSTLAALVSRLFDPWAGRVTLDGRDLRSVRLRSVRAQVALVPQEPFLFPASVADNIAYGRPQAPRAAVEEAARAAGAHDFVARLPQGYDTVLGERGATLSGGERQRLSVARALLLGAPVLVLDEPTSALDAETEAALMAALGRGSAGRATLIIAHRPSTIRAADRIVVLRDGQVVDGDFLEARPDGEQPSQVPAMVPPEDCPLASGAGR